MTHLSYSTTKDTWLLTNGNNIKSVTVSCAYSVYWNTSVNSFPFNSNVKLSIAAVTNITLINIQVIQSRRVCICDTEKSQVAVQKYCGVLWIAHNGKICHLWSNYKIKNRKTSYWQPGRQQKNLMWSMCLKFRMQD